MGKRRPIGAIVSDFVIWDQRISAWLARGARARHPLHRACVVLARTGDGLVWLVLGLLVALLAPPRSRLIVLRIAAACVFAALLVAGIKFGMRRERPHGAESARWSSMPRYDLYSFPSGHAARAACIATSVFVVTPVVGLPLLAWALVVCAARVAVAAHYCLDVLVGGLVGGLVAGAVAGAWPLLMAWAQR